MELETIKLKQEEKHCPRCNHVFLCKVGDIANCQCSKMDLSEETIAFLKSTYYKDCLCNICLQEINNMNLKLYKV